MSLLGPKIVSNSKLEDSLKLILQPLSPYYYLITILNTSVVWTENSRVSTPEPEIQEIKEIESK